MIARETIDAVRERAGLVDVVGESVKLVRRGRSFVGLCPFHQERTPSFHVNEERGFYHCFGCAAHGDAIKFVQETEGLDFADAVRRLAERAGVQIVESRSDAEHARTEEASRRKRELYDANAAAAAFFEEMMRTHPLASYAGRELEQRGLGPDRGHDVADTLQAFRIGYAPYSWDGLARKLAEAGQAAIAAEKAGLLVPRQNRAGHYDRFRHRLMFAVTDLTGRVVAFSGRALPEPTPEDLRAHALEPLGATSGSEPAKYVNSPESPIYQKRETLFGLHQARQSLRASENAIVVEGNFDVVSLHARGVKNVVAPLGTAFTFEQARQLRRFTPTATLLFDGDAAGRRAAAAARKACQQAELRARVAVLPDGMDPDDLARQRGAEGIERVVAASSGMLEYLIETALDEGFAADDSAARAGKIREVAELLAEERDPALRSMAEQHANRIAERLGINDARTFRALAATVERALSGGVDKPRGSVPSPAAARSRDRREDIAREIFGALLDYPALFDTPEVVDAIEHVEGEYAAAIAALRQSREGESSIHPEQVLAKMAPPIHPFALARLAAPRHDRLESAKAELFQNVKKLQRLTLSRQKGDVLRELERARRAGDFEAELALLREHERRARERHNL